MRSRRTPLARLAPLGLAALLLAACSSSKNAATPQRLCTPGAYVFCRCENKDEGTKLCKEDGQSFDSCLPCDGSGATPPGGGGTDGIGGHSGGPSGDDPGSDPSPVDP